MLSTRITQHWFHRFKKGNFKLDDFSRSGRLSQVDMNLLKQLIEEDLKFTARCLAERLGCSHITVEIHLHEMENVEIWSLDTT